jgi:hypothetical protein
MPNGFDRSDGRWNHMLVIPDRDRYRPRMRIRVSGEIRSDHDALRSIVVAAFGDLAGDDVEVRIEPPRTRAQAFWGRAYADPPPRWRTAPRTRFVVRLFVPRRLVDRGYPKTYRYRARTTAPWITVDGWRERLLALAAHEACHVRQFRDGSRRSEIQAERWALQILTTSRRPEPEPERQLQLFVA